jgi:hypothetical protein
MWNSSASCEASFHRDVMSLYRVPHPGLAEYFALKRREFSFPIAPNGPDSSNPSGACCVAFPMGRHGCIANTQMQWAIAQRFGRFGL